MAYLGFEVAKKGQKLIKISIKAHQSCRRPQGA